MLLPARGAWIEMRRVREARVGRVLRGFGSARRQGRVVPPSEAGQGCLGHRLWGLQERRRGVRGGGAGGRAHGSPHGGRLRRGSTPARSPAPASSRRAAGGADGIAYRDVMAREVSRLAQRGLVATSYVRRDGTVVNVPVDVGLRRALHAAGRQRRMGYALEAAGETSGLVEVSWTRNARKSHAGLAGRRLPGAQGEGGRGHRPLSGLPQGVPGWATPWTG